MNLMPDDYEPPSSGAGASKKLQPAVELARANPGRWVLVTELGSEASAASRTSGLRKNAAAEGLEFAKDGLKVLVRSVAEPEPTGELADPEPHWPDAEEPAPELATGGPVPAPHLGLPS